MWWGRVKDKENARLDATEAYGRGSASGSSGVLSYAQWTATAGGHAPAALSASRKQYQARHSADDSSPRSLGRPPLQRSAASNAAVQLHHPLSPGSVRTATRYAAQDVGGYDIETPPRKPPQQPATAQHQDSPVIGVGPLGGGIGRYALGARAAAAPAAAPLRPQHSGGGGGGDVARGGGMKRAPGSGIISRAKPASAYTPVKRIKVCTLSNSILYAPTSNNAALQRATARMLFMSSTSRS